MQQSTDPNSSSRPAASRPGVRLVMVAALLVLGIWLATIAVMSIPRSTRGIDLAAGGVTFRDRCGACHVVEKGISTHHGPNLYDFGKLAGTRKPGMSGERYVLESVLDPDVFIAPENRRGMPRNLGTALSPAELRNVVAYVMSRGGSPDFDAIARLDIPDRRGTTPTRTIRLEDMQLADRVLRERGECLQCHALYRNAEYTVFAPPLFGVGLSDIEQLRESITDPNKLVAPAHRGVNVVLKDGRVVSGKLISRTADRLVLIARGEQNERLRVDLAISDVETEDEAALIVPSEVSPMPSGLDKQLTPEEFDALVTLIRQLN
jgi:putative heme-binding domain-containing protein